jgi:N-acetylglucosamine-6-sulfatase
MSLSANPLRVLAALLATAALATAGLLIGQNAAAAGPGSPNIIFFLTDDETAQEMIGMPQTNALIASQGATFSRAYISYPLCCPSRATFFTGRYMHNHGVRGNAAPTGGAQTFKDRGNEAQDLPVRLKAAGYRTAHIGKYLNGYGGGASCGPGDPYIPAGWDYWAAKMAATQGSCSENNYYQYSMFENGPGHPAGGEAVDYGSATTDYQTDVYRNHALDVLNADLPSTTPLYMEVDFGAPHGPFEPAPRHKFTLSSAPLAPLPGFDEKNISDKPLWLRLKARHKLTSSEKANIVTRRRRRLEMLLGVDEAIQAIYNKVAAAGELSNTYFVFSSDNGFFNGEHRIGSGKYLPYEPSSHVPMLIRGPGIPAGSTSELVSNADYMPTVLDMAGASASASAPVDGRSMLPYARNPAARSTRPILLEGDVGPGIGPGQIETESYKRPRPQLGRSRAARLGVNKLKGVTDLDQEPGFVHFAVNGNIDVPAFKGIRTSRYAYYIYATGDQELYDMSTDPGQLNNVVFNRRYKKVAGVMYRDLLQLAFCQGPSCRADYGRDPKPKPKKKKHGRKKK